MGWLAREALQRNGRKDGRGEDGDDQVGAGFQSRVRIDCQRMPNDTARGPINAKKARLVSGEACQAGVK